MHAADQQIEQSNINNWETIMRAADILSRFWSRSREFTLWTVEAPYQNGYGNWIDPKNGSVLDQESAAKLTHIRLAA